MWFPFVCLAAGVLLGLHRNAAQIARYADPVVHGGLIVLMLTLGAKVGSSEALFSKLDLVGFQCLIVAFCAIAGSALFMVALEKTILPLAQVRLNLLQEKAATAQAAPLEQLETTGAPPLLWVMPGSLIAGVLGGYLALPADCLYLLDGGVTFSLFVLYIGVGMSFGMNSGVLQSFKKLSWRVAFIPVAITLGSLAGGGLAGVLLDMPLRTTVAAAAGMSYYSLTGAMLTQAYGIEGGTYGFLVNVAREFLTVLLAPLLARISPGSPIAAGAAGNMDTMLVPVTKVIGAEFGLVTLITGTILTFLVPFLLTFLLICL